MKQSQISIRADALTAAARAIVEAEKATHDAKTARLRKARLDKEAAGLSASAPGKPRARALKAKGRKQLTDVFVLRPINDKDPAWERSSSRAMCQVWADSEAHARELAAREFSRGDDTMGSPWLSPDKVHCSLAEAVLKRPPEGHARVVKL